MIDEGKNVFAQSVLETEVAKQELLDLQLRHGEFMKLEKQIEEVARLFKDIADLVQTQGDMVDNIEEHVNRATIDVEKGKKELGEAERHQRSARKKKVIL